MLILQRCYMNKVFIKRFNVNSSLSLLSSTAIPIVDHLESNKLVVREVRNVIPSRVSSWSFCTSAKIRETEVDEGFVVEGVWVFHRHGDRTPSRSLVAPHMYEEEASYWRSKIPQPARVYHEAFNHHFPITYVDNSDSGENDDNDKKENSSFIDGKKEPYGYLTYRGMDQMKQVGQDLLHHYHHHHHLDIHQKNAPAENTFHKHWNIRAFSTDYLRTVKSVQCLLDGLIHNTCNSTNNITDNPTSFANLSAQEYLEQRGSTGSTNHGIKVEIRGRKIDTLNAFDRDAPLMKSLVTEIAKTDYFRSGDVKAAPLAARLANYLPGLADSKCRSNFGGPSGINWIHASDHFVCRSSHNLPFSAFSNNNHSHSTAMPITGDQSMKNGNNNFIEGEDEQILAAMSHQTISHLAWRFHQWYTSAPLLAEIAAPPLREIMSQIQTNIASLSFEDIATDHKTTTKATSDDAPRKKPFVIYSCHDVTILSLLYAIQANVLNSSETNLDGYANSTDDDKIQPNNTYWPPYASTLIFELIRIDSSGKCRQFQKVNDATDLYKIRILLNGEVIGIQNCYNIRDNDNDGKSAMIHISDLENIIQKLEEKRHNSDSTTMKVTESI